MVLQSWPEDNNGSGATFTFFRDKPRWTRQGMLLTYTVSPTATDDHLAWDAMREASWSSTFRLLYLKAKKEYVEAIIFKSKEGIRGTIKIVYMNIWFDEFDSSANSIRMEHGIKHHHPVSTDDGDVATVA
uniref:Uncharacterized protein n=1 Tax=Oryza barthii TaxID=65489 RepID=A0A0D3FUE7_9ORYZ